MRFPTPWEWEEDTMNSIRIVDADGITVAQVVNDDDDLTQEERDIADHIVAAVNEMNLAA